MFPICRTFVKITLYVTKLSSLKIIIIILKKAKHTMQHVDY